MSSYGTRRSSAIQMGAPKSSVDPSGAASFATPPLSSSVGKHKRPSTISKSRRLSSSNHVQRPQSVPVGSGFAAARGRSVSVSQGDDDDEADAARPASRRDKDKNLYECEMCSKVYRHSTCLTKHRWEHTAHWKEASKLLLSKHQQVQLLEGAAILAAASAGTSLPDEKSFWPAAVSPPSSGLLGSGNLGINIHALAASSPRFTPSSLLSDNGDFASSRSEVSMDEDDSDDEEEGSSPAPEGLSLTMEEDEPLEDGMFDLDLGGSGDSPSPHLIPLPNVEPSNPGSLVHAAASMRTGATAIPRHVSPSGSDSAPPSVSSSPGSHRPVRPEFRSNDSGFGSLSRSGTLKPPTVAATQAAVQAGQQVHQQQQQQQVKAPLLGFFPPSNQTSMAADSP
ncbi:hypothetical protein JCM10212_001508 [Sporobolomyces blumeae]